MNYLDLLAEQFRAGHPVSIHYVVRKIQPSTAREYLSKAVSRASVEIATHTILSKVMIAHEREANRNPCNRADCAYVYIAEANQRRKAQAEL